MRAEAVSWDDWTAVNVPPVVEEDKWHVALAPGEVKVVSLEQLDDLFRLSIVDAETKVWQNGMTEWQPLRVIADLDDAPDPEPKRTHPKPPSPRSAPPPPRPQSVASPSPSVRPAPPPARPQSVAPPSPNVWLAPSPSIRPAPPPPPQQSVAPRPAYAEPFGLAATQPAFPVSVAVQASTSVRPLIVSARPPVPQSAGGFGRFLIGLSLVAGLSVSLYRNGVVRDAAQSLHQGALFTKLESALGGPPFGTVRALEEATATRDGLTLTSDLNASLVADVPTRGPAAPAEPASTRAAVQPQMPVVALESLQPEKAGTLRPKVDAASNPAPTPTPKAVTHARSDAAPSVKATPAKPAAVEKQSVSKPASEMSERERLNAAIGQSMFSTPKSKSKAKSKANEYDPLNPQL